MGEKYIKRPVPTGTESVGSNGRANWDVIQYRFDTFNQQRTGSRLARRIARIEDIRTLSKGRRRQIGRMVSKMFQQYGFLKIALGLNEIETVEVHNEGISRDIISDLEERLKQPLV